MELTLTSKRNDIDKAKLVLTERAKKAGFSGIGAVTMVHNAEDETYTYTTQAV